MRLRGVRMSSEAEKSKDESGEYERSESESSMDESGTWR